MADIVIAGYLGFANSGDEALLTIVLSEIKRLMPDKTITVLSMRPRQTEVRHGVRAIYRYDIVALLREFMNSRVFVFGGGSLIQNATSRRSLGYYLFLLDLAKRCGMKTMLFSNGIGPLRRGVGRKKAARMLSQVDAITLRDADSAALLSEIGASASCVTVTADTAFLLADAVASGGCGVSYAGIADGTRYAVISVRPWGRAGGDCVTSVSRLCRHLNDSHGITPLLIPMQYPRDVAVSERAAKASGVDVHIWRGAFSAEDVMSVFGGAVLAVGMRLHTLIFAAVTGVPYVGISYDPKVSSFCREAGLPSVDIHDSPEALCRAADGVIGHRRELSERVVKMARQSAVAAAKNTSILAELFSDAEHETNKVKNQ